MALSNSKNKACYPAPVQKPVQSCKCGTASQQGLLSLAPYAANSDIRLLNQSCTWTLL